MPFSIMGQFGVFQTRFEFCEICRFQLGFNNKKVVNTHILLEYEILEKL